MTLITDHPPVSRPEPGTVIVIENASWDLYERVVREMDERNVRITYDKGRMALMSRLPIHERVKTLTGRLIEFATFELDIPVCCLGSTTWKRKDLAKALEVDECYYIQNEPRVHGRTDLDLKRDPPPDLAVEVDITHVPVDRPSVYASPGVGELWRYDGARFAFLRRNSKGNYEPISSSAALPFMTPQIVDRFIALMLADENAGLRAFRDWLRSLPSS